MLKRTMLKRKTAKKAVKRKTSQRKTLRPGKKTAPSLTEMAKQLHRMADQLDTLNKLTKPKKPKKSYSFFTLSGKYRCFSTSNGELG